MMKLSFITRCVLGPFLFLVTQEVANAQITTQRRLLRHDPANRNANPAANVTTEQRDRKLFKRFQGITGGSDANGEDYPFFALIFGSETNDNFYYCGGSLITPTVVLTAAHCITPDDPPVRVRIGGTTNTEGESILVDSVLVHPRYDEENFLASDFALLYLAEASTAPPVTLNQDTTFPDTAGTALKTIGYGATEDGTASTNLKQVDLVYIEFDTCQATYYDGIQESLHECVDGADPSEGPCVGDSGGPLLYEETIAIGVLSFGAPCGTEGVDVYAKISDNYAWIAENAGLTTPAPTAVPSSGATEAPTVAPTLIVEPTDAPSLVDGPTDAPSLVVEPTDAPSLIVEPTDAPSLVDGPTDVPAVSPTIAPSLIVAPTTEPTEAETDEPTAEPTEEPTAEPTEEPTTEPTQAPEPTTSRPTFVPLPLQSSLCSFQALWGGDIFECLGP